MNASRLVCHVMWVDFRAQRWMLAGWGLVLLAQAALFAAGPERVGGTPSRIDYDFGIAIVRFGWTIIVAALLVQSDSLVGTTAFWMTRPIPRAVLFTAKLLSAVIWLVMIPIAVMAAVLFWLGMNPLDALAGGGMIGLEQAVILAMAIMAALVTADIGQLIVAGIAGVTLVSVFNILLLPVLTLTWPSVSGTLSSGQTIVYAVAVIAGGLAISAYHYLTLRAWQSLVLVACVMFAATALTRLWPSPPVVPAIGPAPESVMSSSAVSFNASSLVPRIEDTATVSPDRRTISKTKKILLELTPVGHPPGVYFWPAFVRTEIRFPALSPIQWSGPSTLRAVDRASTDGDDGQPWRSIHIALGDVDLETPRPVSYFTPITDVSPAEFVAHASTPGQLKTDITMIAYRYEVTAEAPLKAGVGFRRAGRAARIVSVTSLNPGVRIELRETLLEGTPPLAKDEFGTSWYVLRNSARRQAVLLAWKDRKTFEGTVGIAATGVTTTRTVLEVETAPESSPRFHVDATWLDGAELVLVEPIPLGVLTRSLTIDNFILGGPPVGDSAGQADDASSASPPSLLLVRGDASEAVIPLAPAFGAVRPESPIPNPQSRSGSLR